MKLIKVCHSPDPCREPLLPRYCNSNDSRTHSRINFTSCTKQYMHAKEVVKWNALHLLSCLKNCFPEFYSLVYTRCMKASLLYLIINGSSYPLSAELIMGFSPKSPNPFAKFKKMHLPFACVYYLGS